MQLEMVIAFTTYIFELHTLINKVRNCVDKGITDKQRERALAEVSACLALLEK